MRIIIYILAVLFALFISFIILILAAEGIEYLIKFFKILNKYQGIKKRWFNFNSYSYYVGRYSGCKFYNYFKTYTYNGMDILVHKADGEVLFNMKKFVDGLIVTTFMLLFCSGFFSFIYLLTT